jgi:hypothetical protein
VIVESVPALSTELSCSPMTRLEAQRCTTECLRRRVLETLSYKQGEGKL